MKTTARALIVFLASSGTAVAASGAEAEANGFLVTLFLAFGALVIAFQLVPGLILFGSMVRGLFSRPADEAAAGDSGSER